MPGKPTIPRVCRHCGTAFLTYPNRVRKGEALYCGTTCAHQANTRPLADRFWEKVARAGPDECWLWTAGTYRHGYGQFAMGGGRKRGAPRVAWELTNGPIPDGVFVCHRCDNPPCVNPAHLFLDTNGGNMRDAWSKGRNVFQKHPERIRRGAAAPSAVLTEDQVREIRARLATGRHGIRAALAREFGVAPGTIGWIRNGHSWRHVGG